MKPNPQAATQQAIDPVEALILDLLEWIGPGWRSRAEVLEAWRTSCPKLPVWEEANLRGFIDQGRSASNEAAVAVSKRGREHLALALKAPA